MQLNCPACFQVFPVSEADEGQKVRCPTCGQKILAPMRPNAANKTVLVSAEVLPVATVAQRLDAPFHCHFCRRPLYAHEVRRKEVKVGESRADFFETRTGNQTHYAMVDVCPRCGADDVADSSNDGVMMGIFAIVGVFVFLGIVALIVALARH